MNLTNTTLMFEQPVWVAVSLAILFFLLVLFAWRPGLRLMNHFRLQYLIKRLGQAVIKNIYLSDNVGEPIYIEQLVLTPEGLIVVMVKPFRGAIFAAEHIEQWTQVIRHHSYKFPNPLHQLESDVQGLKSIFPKTVISGMVLFAKGGQFPKGKPSNVIAYPELKLMTALPNTDSVPTELENTWQTITQQAQPATHTHESTLYRRGDKPRFIFAVIGLMGLLAYAIAYWML